MKQQIHTWQLVNKSLQQQVPVLLLYVLQSKGSSPGRQGFSMAVTAIGEIAGSIGGGIMEHKFIEMAKERLAKVAGYKEPVTDAVTNNALSSIDIKQQFHNKTAAHNRSGMICSGEQSVLIYPVTDKDAGPVQQLINSLAQNKNGTLQLSPAGLQFSADIPETDYRFSMQSETDWLYTEKTGYKNHLHIVGAGHCALALSRLMTNMDFYLHLYDDRSSLRTYEQNNYVQEKQAIQDYTALQELIPAGNNQYVVIMTVGYRTDDIALSSIWHKHLRYIGLLGSQSKIDKLFTDYRAAGIPEATLAAIHAPVGIAIHSQTPDEIAISIAAEIIQEKNRL
jgi:xanthine dehydrogenase accessory factor